MIKKFAATLKNKLPLILIILGVLIAAYPVAGQLYARYQEDRMLEEWLNSIDVNDLEDLAGTDPEAAYAELQKAFGAEGGTSGTDGDAESAAGLDDEESGTDGSGGSKSSGSDLSNQKVLGIIQIPKIKVKDPI
ncbi:MAG TPA: hypothetical protein PK423_10210, partial [Clostridiales bacterium]|nr:hypothetical protein [Clostridiales bacterium]